MKNSESFDRTPDKPQSFGYKVSWFALKADDPATVLGAMEVEGAMPANWASGLKAAYGHSLPEEESWVFVSPPVNGWVLAISSSLPYPFSIEAEHRIGEQFDTLFARLMLRFDDVQFFGSHRVCGFAAWARAIKGKAIRIFSHADVNGEVWANFGAQTPEEASLGLADLTGLSPIEATERLNEIAEDEHAGLDKLIASGLSRHEAYAKIRQSAREPTPDESDVVDLAALWSLDPTRLSDQDYHLGLGLVAQLPKTLA